jgi:hypothetical protein
MLRASAGGCVVTKIAFQHEGKTETTENGVKLMVHENHVL